MEAGFTPADGIEQRETCNPNRPPLILSNNEILPMDTQIRTCILDYSKGKLVEHPHGIFRRIELIKIVHDKTLKQVLQEFV